MQRLEYISEARDRLLDLFFKERAAAGAADCKFFK